MNTTSMSENGTMEQRLIQFGALSGIAGAIIFIVANIVHPRSPDISSTLAQVETVARSTIWLTDHLFLFMGGFLLMCGLLALRRMLSASRGSIWAEFGYMAGVVSTSVWTVLMALDGITSKVIHSGWAMAPVAGKMVAAQIAEMMEQIDIGIFSLYIIIFFGITLFFYGMAVATSKIFPVWLGGVAIVLSIGAFIVGIVQAYTGLSVLVTNMLFASFSSFLTLWMLVMNILMVRRVRAGMRK